MKYTWILGLAIALLALVQVAAAQDDQFPSVKVAEMVKGSVVSIDANSVGFGSIAGFADLEMGRTGTLSTKRMTGFIYNKDGYIVTDSSDIETATLLTVRFPDGSELPAEIVGVDSFYGVGVIKVDPNGKQLKPVKILDVSYDPTTDSYPYDQGDSVVAIGYSGGFGGTVTYGIISAVRNFRNRNQVLLPSVIQTDVVINTGNEGSPLFNDEGEVIAMHERRGGGGSMQNTTFFTPITVIKRAVDEIIEDSKKGREIDVWHPWLGIKPFSGSQRPALLGGGIRTVGDDLKMFYDIPEQYWDVGVWLDAVYPESPAREYGLLNKDILMHLTVLNSDETLKADYHLLKNIQDLELMVTSAEEGEIFVFGVLRNRRMLDIEVVIGQHPGAFNRQGLPDNAGNVDSSDYF